MKDFASYVGPLFSVALILIADAGLFIDYIQPTILDPKNIIAGN
jgi:hypothetical protein